MIKQVGTFVQQSFVIARHCFDNGFDGFFSYFLSDSSETFAEESRP
jgi:hypothetical protein